MQEQQLSAAILVTAFIRLISTFLEPFQGALFFEATAIVAER
jgi:hypothetical protein